MRCRIARVPSGVRLTRRPALGQPLAQRGGPLAAERPVRHASDALVQVFREHLAGHAMGRGHRAERLEGVEDMLHVVVHPPAQAHLAKRAEGVHIEVSPDRFPDRLREPGHRNRFVHAVDRGQHVGHDHVVQKPHRRGRLIRPDGTADGVAEIERRLERALPQGLGVGQHRPRLRHRHQARALPADQARLLRPVHDQVQARELGGAVEPQALIAGPEQRDQLPGIRGPDVPGRRERPALRAKPIREGTQLPERPCCVRPPR